MNCPELKSLFATPAYGCNSKKSRRGTAAPPANPEHLETLDGPDQAALLIFLGMCAEILDTGHPAIHAFEEGVHRHDGAGPHIRVSVGKR